MRNRKSKTNPFRLKIRNRFNGSSLILVVISLALLSFLGIGMLKVGYGVRHNAIKMKNETAAMLAAEAGYEKAVFWMSQRQDMLSAIQQEDSGTCGQLNFASGDASYQIMLQSFAGSRPVYKVLSKGTCGSFTRTVDVLIIQAISGWDMGKCEIPTGTSSTAEVLFVDGEIIDMPLHINDQQDNPDNIDIHVSGDPQFLQTVGMGESRYTDGGGDKYGSVLNTFDNGITFDQPDNRITDSSTVQNKITRFRDSTNPLYKYTPVASSSVSNSYATVQLEFFVDEDDIGKVRITNDCTVRGQSPNQYDYKVKEGSGGDSYEKYYIYGYHYAPEDANDTGQRVIMNVEETYVSQDFDGVESEPGGQIYVDGNVVIGGSLDYHDGSQVVKGKVTVVATGNIWIADSITVDGTHDTDGKPSEDNPNILGLVAEGIIKVVDPGLSEAGITEVTGYEYAPIGLEDTSSSSSSSSGNSGGKGGGKGGGKPGNNNSSESETESESEGNNNRLLPQEMVIEAAITVGGGGWGAENVYYYSGGRKNTNTKGNDDLILRGTITEVIRGIVGHGTNGYLKNYYFDSRVLEGILPGDMWLQGKYVPAPAGWHDYRPVDL